METNQEQKLAFPIDTPSQLVEIRSPRPLHQSFDEFKNSMDSLALRQKDPKARLVEQIISSEEESGHLTKKNLSTYIVYGILSNIEPQDEFGAVRYPETGVKTNPLRMRTFLESITAGTLLSDTSADLYGKDPLLTSDESIILEENVKKLFDIREEVLKQINEGRRANQILKDIDFKGKRLDSEFNRCVRELVNSHSSRFEPAGAGMVDQWLKAGIFSKAKEKLQGKAVAEDIIDVAKDLRSVIGDDEYNSEIVPLISTCIQEYYVSEGNPFNYAIGVMSLRMVLVSNELFQAHSDLIDQLLKEVDHKFENLRTHVDPVFSAETTLDKKIIPSKETATVPTNKLISLLTSKDEKEESQSPKTAQEPKVIKPIPEQKDQSKTIESSPVTPVAETTTVEPTSSGPKHPALKQTSPPPEPIIREDPKRPSTIPDEDGTSTSQIQSTQTPKVSHTDKPVVKRAVVLPDSTTPSTDTDTYHPPTRPPKEKKIDPPSPLDEARIAAQDALGTFSINKSVTERVATDKAINSYQFALGKQLQFLTVIAEDSALNSKDKATIENDQKNIATIQNKIDTHKMMSRGDKLENLTLIQAKIEAISTILEN